jgi:VWFA-related protein
MKKCIFILGIIALVCLLTAQELQHEAVAVNIEVPVRVYRGDTFVDSLTIDDFEIFEEGKLQKIDAVYLIKKTDIQRKEEVKSFTPQTFRNFYLFFEIAEYDPKIDDALQYFFHNVLQPGDNLSVITPVTTYRMKSETLQVLDKAAVTKQLQEKLRHDAWIGNSEYRAALKELEGIARSISGSQSGGTDVRGSRAIGTQSLDLEQQLELYAEYMQKLENLRQIEQKKLMDFAEHLKEKEGQKNVFLFYQKEFIPQLSPGTFNRLISANVDNVNNQFAILGNFEFFKRDLPIDVEKVKQAFSDSSIAIHFLLFSTIPDKVPGLIMLEHSEDVYNAFDEMAVATGGFTSSSGNPEFLFQGASDASENYYLLYYTPKDYQMDGKFKKIKVQVKDQRFRVTHRAGYFAD